MGAWGVAGLLGVWLAGTTAGQAQPQAAAGIGLARSSPRARVPRTERRRPRGTSRPGAKTRPRPRRTRGSESARRWGQRAGTPTPTLGSSAARHPDRRSDPSSRPASDQTPAAGPRLLPGARRLEQSVAGDARAIDALPPLPSVPRATHGGPAALADSTRATLRSAGPEAGLDDDARSGTFPPGPTMRPGAAGLEAPVDGDKSRDRTGARDPEVAHGRPAPTGRGHPPEGTSAGGTRRTGTGAPVPGAIAWDEDDLDAPLAAAPPSLPWTLLQPLP